MQQARRHFEGYLKQVDRAVRASQRHTPHKKRQELGQSTDWSGIVFAMASSKPFISPGISTGTHPIGWLDSNSQYGNILATAQLHLKLKRLIDEALPAPLRGVFDVIKIETAALTLTVSSAAFAAKFRQLAPSVTRHLNHKGWNFTEVKLKVQGAVDVQVPIKASREARLLQPSDLESFEKLLETLRPGPLADSVARLIAHHRRSE